MLRSFAVFLFCTSSLFAGPMMFIGIAGGTGSGKTTLAERIHQKFPGSVLISQDSYYRDISHLSVKERKERNFDHPDSLEFSLLRAHLLDLKEGRSINVPIYDFCEHMRVSETKHIEPANIVIIEGILLLAVSEVRDLFDLKIFVDTDNDERVLRRIERDIKERGRTLDDVKAQYLKTVKPMHDIYVEPSKKFADIIIPEGGYNEIALSLILAKLTDFA